MTQSALIRIKETVLVVAGPDRPAELDSHAPQRGYLQRPPVRADGTRKSRSIRGITPEDVRGTSEGGFFLNPDPPGIRQWHRGTNKRRKTGLPQHAASGRSREALQRLLRARAAACGVPGEVLKLKESTLILVFFVLI